MPSIDFRFKTDPREAIDPHEFDGRRVLVTGGSKGVGQAVVTRMRESGARVLTTTRKPGKDADANLFVSADGFIELPRSL